MIREGVFISFRIVLLLRFYSDVPFHARYRRAVIALSYLLDNS
jgi:hypothetical protein